MAPCSWDLTGRRVLVTGSSRGLGFEMASVLVDQGCSVVLNGRDEVALRQAAIKLGGRSKPLEWECFDVTNEEQIKDSIARIEASGAIDILVNNAGLQIRAPLEDFEESNWRAILDTNLTGAFLVSKHVAKRMITRQYGKIVNICSLQSALGRKTIAPYAASKGGLKMLTKAMAVEWASNGIQVNAIGPGYFKSEMTRALWEDEAFDSWLTARTPAGRWGEMHELSGALVLFCSSASDYINGQILYVDGGILSAI